MMPRLSQREHLISFAKWYLEGAICLDGDHLWARYLRNEIEGHSIKSLERTNPIIEDGRCSDNARNALVLVVWYDSSTGW